MKKVIFFILIFIIICFFIPIIFTMKRKTEEVLADIQENDIEEVAYNYEEYSNIKLLHNETNEIEEIPLDEYLVRSSMRRDAS